MKSVIASAVLGAAALVNAASIPHGHAHAHTHARRASIDVQKRAPINFMSAADVSRLADVKDSLWNAASSIMEGKNIAADADSEAPIAVGGKGPFLVEFKNESPEDIILVAWSDLNKTNPWDAANVKTCAPDVTHTLRSNTTTTISYNPNVVASKKISGGWAGIYADTTVQNGFVYNTWGEATFRTDNAFSTTDVSRLPNMNGNDMEIYNYAKQGDDEPACESTMTKCSFICPPGQDKCTEGGTIQDCPVGAAGNTASADKKDGGCGGLTQTGGFIKVSFF
ncbi:proteinral negative regulator of transcription subunit 4 [Elsinoe australis]|uniref:Proteinral negative regulator of transcription subunit 4 n=1 Tax=Elsinoe australis TaxID=40998 RepID=A0A2P7Z4F9_9PEZI|nr:proteinral negative regulator of transcription subunit 4 [Elsinoe australis]